MARRRFQLTEEQVKELTSAYASCKDGPTRTRYQALRRYGTGYPTQEVMSIAGCGWSTVMEWCRTHRRERIRGLVDKRVGGNRAKLIEEQLRGLGQRLGTYTPANLNETIRLVITHISLAPRFSGRYRSMNTGYRGATPRLMGYKPVKTDLWVITKIRSLTIHALYGILVQNGRIGNS